MAVPYFGVVDLRVELHAVEAAASRRRWPTVGAGVGVGAPAQSPPGTFAI